MPITPINDLLFKIFICPINKTVMECPVICDDGYTYELAAVLEHIRKYPNGLAPSIIIPGKHITCIIQQDESLLRLKSIFLSKFLQENPEYLEAPLVAETQDEMPSLEAIEHISLAPSPKRRKYKMHVIQPPVCEKIANESLSNPYDGTKESNRSIISAPLPRQAVNQLNFKEKRPKIVSHVSTRSLSASNDPERQEHQLNFFVNFFTRHLVTYADKQLREQLIAEARDDYDKIMRATRCWQMQQSDINLEERLRTQYSFYLAVSPLPDTTRSSFKHKMKVIISQENKLYNQFNNLSDYQKQRDMILTKLQGSPTERSEISLQQISPFAAAATKPMVSPITFTGYIPGQYANEISTNEAPGSSDDFCYENLLYPSI